MTGLLETCRNYSSQNYAAIHLRVSTRISPMRRRTEGERKVINETRWVLNGRRKDTKAEFLIVSCHVNQTPSIITLDRERVNDTQEKHLKKK
jgi:ribosomal protein L44E